ncbi:hypothetical protein NKH14_17690 [Mesorhizobium sp. M1380]|uniref:hypothetical protein n=1 Tax=Mesorhizobium sp. M1380 TaxID=2957093 RepID=UPI00333ABF1C
MLLQPKRVLDPLTLFTTGVDGAWYDPSDLSSLWQDTAATTPVAADGDPIRRMNDKSGNGHNLTTASLAASPLYRINGALRWLEFDGVDDTMSSALTMTLSLPSYIAACFSKAAQNSTSFFSLIKDASNYQRLINVATNNRMSGALRSTAHLTAITPTSANNNFPAATIKVADTLSISGLTDLAVNGLPSGTSPVANLWVGGDTVAGCGVQLGIGNGMNFYGGIVLLGDPAASRLPINRYLGAKGGLAL